MSAEMKGAGRRTVFFLLSFQVVLIILAAIFLRYGKDADATAKHTNENEFTNRYPMFQDIHVMIFVGFGFLMTFLRKYGFSSVGFNFLLSAVILQWGLFCQGIFDLDPSDSKIRITVASLIGADVLTAAILISMGAVLGKTTPLQLVIMGIIETVLFAVNEMIGHKLQVTDAGDSIFVHVFGAYFGLAVSKVLGKPQNSELEGSSYTSDLFAMIGSIFLWLFWPSFNGALSNGDDQHRAVINTYISLAACCVTAFAVSSFVTHKNKFNMVHIQNATLAGGVAIGTSADLMVQPFGAMIVGSLAGILSVCGYHFLQPFLLRKMGLHDTCGVHNLHGMPGVFAGIVGAIVSFMASQSNYGDSLYLQFPARAPVAGSSDLLSAQMNINEIAPGQGRTAAGQAGFQLLAIVITLAIAIVGGAVTGTILRYLSPLTGKVEDKHVHNDAQHWEMHWESETEEVKLPPVETHEQVVDDKC